MDQKSAVREAIVRSDMAKLADMRDLYNARERWLPHEAAWLFKMATRGINAPPPDCRCCGNPGADWDHMEMCDECAADYDADMREEQRREEADEAYDRHVDQMLADMAAEHDTPKGA